MADMKFQSKSNVNIDELMGNELLIEKLIDELNLSRIWFFRYGAATDDVLSKPLKCGYDPYSGTWSEWVLDSDKSKVIAHYSLIEKIMGDK